MIAATAATVTTARLVVALIRRSVTDRVLLVLVARAELSGASVIGVPWGG